MKENLYQFIKKQSLIFAQTLLFRVSLVRDSIVTPSVLRKSVLAVQTVQIHRGILNWQQDGQTDLIGFVSSFACLHGLAISRIYGFK